MRFAITQQLSPVVPRPYRIVETVDTLDGPRSRICEGTWATLDEVLAHLDLVVESLSDASS